MVLRICVVFMLLNNLPLLFLTLKFVFAEAAVVGFAGVFLTINAFTVNQDGEFLQIRVQLVKNP